MDAPLRFVRKVLMGVGVGASFAFLILSVDESLFKSNGMRKEFTEKILRFKSCLCKSKRQIKAAS